MKSQQPSWRGRSMPVLALAAVLALAGCSSFSGTSNGTGDSGAGVSLPSPLLSAALDAVKKQTAGQNLSGSVAMLDVSGGNETKIIDAALKPFTDATGVAVNHTGSEDANAVMTTRLRAGNPPDIYYPGPSSVGNLQTYIASGKLVPVSDFLDMATIKSQYSPQLLNLMTSNGKLYGVPAELDGYGLWYNPKQYTGPSGFSTWNDLLTWSVANGSTTSSPWCMHLGKGAGTGSAATYVLENILLEKYGPDVEQKFAKGQLSFTSPEVTYAYQQFGKIFTDDKLVYGGPTGVLSANAAATGAGMYTNPAQCFFTFYGGFGQLIYKQNVQGLDIKTDTALMKFPLGNNANSTFANAHMMYLFNSSPEAKALYTYLASPEFQALLASAGQWTVANRAVSKDVIPTTQLQAIQTSLDASDTVVLGAITSMPQDVLRAFYGSFASYLTDPSSLGATLASVESVRQAAAQSGN